MGTIIKNKKPRIKGDVQTIPATSSLLSHSPSDRDLFFILLPPSNVFEKINIGLTKNKSTGNICHRL